jgi:Ran GTPase-activating protein (RanGAP) involved in mRNA processing and transport
VCDRAAEALRTNACGSLRLLSLDSNGLGETGARLLAELIASWHAPHLSHLSLQNNQLRDRGVEVVCGALEAGTCPSLQVSDMAPHPD